MNEAMISGVSPIGGQDDLFLKPQGAVPGAAAGHVDFSKWMTTELSAVNDKLVSSEQGLRELAAGGPVSLHEVMMRAEEARLSFQLMAQVRNKVLDAYQDILRMQA
jgi:flagellar hook-basal body complex protein FliE